MNPALTELHATARRNQLLAEADRRRAARQARVGPGTRTTTKGSVITLATCLGRSRKRQPVPALTA